MNNLKKQSVLELQSTNLPLDASFPSPPERGENQLLALRGLFLRRNELLNSKQPASSKARTQTRKQPRCSRPPSEPERKGDSHDASAGIAFGPGWESGSCGCSAGCIGAQALLQRLLGDAAWYRGFWDEHQVSA